MHEEQRERLRALADSINESARMARATNSLFLFVALYLALTLLSTTDENLLRNGQVVLPQVGAGISVVQSYVLAPVVFLYLHAQHRCRVRIFSPRSCSARISSSRSYKMPTLPGPTCSGPSSLRHGCRVPTLPVPA